MNKHKRGFTLVEILLVITIMSLILAFSIGTVKTIQNSYSSLTYFAYNNIKDMVTEVIAGRMPLETGGETTVYCRSNKNGIVNILTPDTLTPSSAGSANAGLPINMLPPCNTKNLWDSDNANHTHYNNAAAYKTFCNALMEKVNTKGSDHCELSELYDPAELPSIDFATATPTFIGSNGQRYFLSKRDFDTGISDDFGYRKIAVDLNGTKMPNTTTDNHLGKVPDVVTFVILDNGVVLPTETAANNTSRGTKDYYYINAKIKAQNKDNGSIEYLSVGDPGSITMSFKDAYCASTEERPLKGYCIDDSFKCDPETYNSCNIELIKPAFRFNL